MNYMDFNCFSGNWPFYKVRYNTVEKLAAQHKRIGVSCGVISSLEAIFYQDPYEAELALAKELESTDYLHAMILNPRLPGWKDDLHRAQRDLNIKAVRLVPGYHDYLLTDPIMAEVCAELRQAKLPLILTLRVLDDRSAYGIRPRPIPDAEAVEFLEKNPDIPTLLANVRVAQLKNYLPLFETRQNLFMDTSGFMAGLFPVDDTWPQVGDRLVFGTNAPMTEMFAIRHILDTAAVDSSTKNTILTGTSFLNYFK